MPDFFSEPYLHLAGLSHKTALISWGAFYFRTKDSKGTAKLVDDDDLKHVFPPRRESIGARSEPYGPARVDVFDTAGTLAATVMTDRKNFAWVTGLEPDTQYRYVVTVKGEEWAAGPRRDWDAKLKGLFPQGGSYRNEFRTFPDPKMPSRDPVSFAVIGDFGTGVRKPSDEKRRQFEVAAALTAALDAKALRFLVTTGDNIYASAKIGPIPIGGQGDEDDDWFFTFYQPYRYLINRIPVFPSIGNHDASETEERDDREELLDNLYLRERVAPDLPAGRASLGPGLFYRFAYGSDIELVALDTSKEPEEFPKRLFLHPNNQAFLEAAFPTAGNGPRWRIPFFHHPPHCAGPVHRSTKEFTETIDFSSGRATLLERFAAAGVKVVFSGHEHNFQHSRVDGMDFLVTGGGGKVSLDAPSADRLREAHTQGWCAACHFLLVTIDGRTMAVDAIGSVGESGLARIPVVDPANTPISLPLTFTV
jgi:tartrate-resistant acid phosphatase type 5